MADNQSEALGMIETRGFSAMVEGDELLAVREERALLCGAGTGRGRVHLVHDRKPHRRRHHPGAHVHAGTALHPGGLLQDHLR